MERIEEISICDKCGQPVSKNNSVVYLDLFTGNIDMIDAKDRHIYPTKEGCEGSPSRVKLIQTNPVYKDAYERIQQEE